jgi:hypothetical protein
MHNGGPNDMASTNETKWTKGPWSVGARFIEGENEVLDAEGFSVADPSIFASRKARNGRIVKRVRPVEEQVANANLIAAAPELYEAVRLAFDVVHAGHRALEADCPDIVCRQFHAALAKARGEVRS